MVRPTTMTAQRTTSLPQLLKSKEAPEPTVDIHSFEKQVPNVKPTGPLYGPPKPPRSAVGLERAGNLDRAEIRTALQNWQIGIMMNDQDLKGKLP